MIIVCCDKEATRVIDTLTLGPEKDPHEQARVIMCDVCRKSYTLWVSKIIVHAPVTKA